jgi:putative RecB family exonuclease
MLTEAKPWDATVNGDLNPASYSAIAVFGTVSMAVQELHSADQPITGRNVEALAGTFALIVEEVQVAFTGSSSPQEGMHTRLRGALHTTIETLPVPFGAPTAEWESWVARVTKRVNAIAAAALRLFDHGPPEAPWAALAVDEPVDDFEHPTPVAA